MDGSVSDRSRTLSMSIRSMISSAAAADAACQCRRNLSADNSINRK
ncbi:MAG: hypothetical protein WKF71_11685 [Pyrinomonadaceae bacterium]